MKRRTPLHRKSWLTGGMPLRRTPMKRPKVRTGPDLETRQLVFERDGYRCVFCGGVGQLEVHHRRPRGIGGSLRPDTNQPQNLVSLHPMCHQSVESCRESAREVGLLVPQGVDPATVPLRLARGRWVLLTPAGTYEPIEQGAAS